MEPVTYIALLRACNLVIYRFFSPKMSLKMWSRIGQTMWMETHCDALFLIFLFFLVKFEVVLVLFMAITVLIAYPYKPKLFLLETWHASLFLGPLKSSVGWVFNINISNKTGHCQDTFLQLDVIRGCLCKLFIMYHIYFYCYAWGGWMGQTHRDPGDGCSCCGILTYATQLKSLKSRNALVLTQIMIFF